MIIELEKEKIDLYASSFLPKEMLLKEFQNNPYAKFLLLLEKEEVIGYLYYSDIYERAEINQFEIKESFRNQGKGDFLLKEFLKRVEKDVTLEVKSDNNPAIRVYEKNGFEKKAIREKYYQGIDGILMERNRSEKDSLK